MKALILIEEGNIQEIISEQPFTAIIADRDLLNYSNDPVYLHKVVVRANLNPIKPVTRSVKEFSHKIDKFPGIVPDTTETNDERIISEMGKRNYWVRVYYDITKHVHLSLAANIVEHNCHAILTEKGYDGIYSFVNKLTNEFISEGIPLKDDELINKLNQFLYEEGNI